MLEAPLMADYPEGFHTEEWSGERRNAWYAKEEAERKARNRRGDEQANPRSRPSGADKRRPAFKTVASFCREYVPLSYTIEGLLRSSSIYALTAKTGAGKTAFNVAAALAVATGRENILGKEVVQGRVAYCAFENPDDVRMRFMIAAFLLNIDLDELGDQLVILDRRDKPEAVIAELAGLAKDGPFALVIAETFAAFFDGKNISDPVEAGEFTRRLRPLTQINGLPSVLVAAHPVKNAGEDALIPYGSGAILNELDGNLTIWKAATGLSLHWQGKLRGLEFEPMLFRLEVTGSPDVLDIKGRQVQLPTLRPADAESVEDRQQCEAATDRALLRVMIDNPNGNQQAWADAIGRAKSSTNGRLQRLQREKLTECVLGKWSATDKARKAVKKPQKGGEQENG